MDLHPIQAKPTDAERAAVDAVLGPAEVEPVLGLREAEARRHLLLPALHAAQGRVGWVSPGALGYICARLHVPPAEGYGVASFYSLFSLKERPAVVAHVCDDIACKAAGADALCAELEGSLGESFGAEPLPRALRAGAGGDARGGGRGALRARLRARHRRARPARRRGSHVRRSPADGPPAGRCSGPAPAPPRGQGRPGEPRRLPRARRLPSAAQRAGDGPGVA